MSEQFDASRPIYAQLVERLKARILAGTYPPGGHLDSVRDLAAAAGVNPNTMQRALAQLESEGLVRTERTSCGLPPPMTSRQIFWRRCAASATRRKRRQPCWSTGIQRR